MTISASADAQAPSDAALAALAEAAAVTLVAGKARVVCAESCTGGWIAQLLTSVPGSSRWFDGGFVAYSNAAKQQMLNVPAATIEAHGAVSEATVDAMARGALAKLSHTTDAVPLAVAVSGVAGPGGGSREKPIGTVWLAWAGSGGLLGTESHHFDGDRRSVRAFATAAALDGLRRFAPALPK